MRKSEKQQKANLTIIEGKCGSERYNLAVHASAYKEKLFGKAGGR